MILENVSIPASPELNAKLLAIVFLCKLGSIEGVGGRLTFVTFLEGCSRLTQPPSD